MFHFVFRKQLSIHLCFFGFKMLSNRKRCARRCRSMVKISERGAWAALKTRFVLLGKVTKDERLAPAFSQRFFILFFHHETYTRRTMSCARKRRSKCTYPAPPLTHPPGFKSFLVPRGAARHASRPGLMRIDFCCTRFTSKRHTVNNAIVMTRRRLLAAKGINTLRGDLVLTPAVPVVTAPSVMNVTRSKLGKAKVLFRPVYDIFCDALETWYGVGRRVIRRIRFLPFRGINSWRKS